eukprot:TRINITY_DN73790_c0_g1_i1.p1 TRINITY_DN73790_c0_g1~~TRINITY_DN73790_c0_g1_i1.p1  ORF type:complete len:388 (+),score=61.49 TRINITY_DN73790_c0_g1_i1:37-1200(+)
MSLPTKKSAAECQRWMQHVHEVQSKRTPEAWQSAMVRSERARQHEVSLRKCKAVKSHAVRSRALATESLRQMSSMADPAEAMAVQNRWKSAQEASKSRQHRSLQKADLAISKSSRASAEDHVSDAEVMSNADDEANQAMVEVAGLMGAADVNAMVAAGSEGLAPVLVEPVSATGDGSGGAALPRRTRTGGGATAGSTVDALLQQLKREPENEEECAAKFLLYEGYQSEVEQMRNTLLTFHQDSIPTVPQAVATDMNKQVASIDSAEAMGIPDDAREWFVYHMMRQAERNNLKMARVLESFEKRLEFLASNDQADCPVCFEAFVGSGPHAPETLACCHKVCKECWENWCSVMVGKPFCPLCRHEDFLGEVAGRVSRGAVPTPGSDSDA